MDVKEVPTVSLNKNGSGSRKNKRRRSSVKYLRGQLSRQFTKQISTFNLNIDESTRGQQVKANLSSFCSHIYKTLVAALKGAVFSVLVSLILALSFSIPFHFDAEAHALQHNHTANITLNTASEATAHYKRLQDEAVIFLIGVAFSGISLNLLWWKVERRVCFGVAFSACAIVTPFAASMFVYSSASAIAYFVFDMTRNFWALNIFLILCAFFLLEGLESCFNLGKDEHRQGLFHVILKAIVYVGITLSTYYFVLANMGPKSTMHRVLVSGVFYPVVEVALKFLYRKGSVSFLGKSEIDQQGVVYVCRNLEVGLGKPNLLIMFLMDSTPAFVGTFCVSTVLQLCALFVTNVRFLGSAMKLRKSLGTTATHKVAPIMKKFSIKNSNIAEHAADKAGSHDSKDDANVSDQEYIDQQKAEFAIIRNCEEVAEKVNLIQCPITIAVLISYGMVDSNLTLAELSIRAACAVGLQMAGQLAKMYINSLWHIWEQRVSNVMDIWGMINIAFLQLCGEAVFLAAFAHVLGNNSM